MIRRLRSSLPSGASTQRCHRVALASAKEA